MPTLQQIQNADSDLSTINDVVNGTVALNGDGTTTNRAGFKLRTLIRLLTDVATTPPLGWQAAFANSPLKGAKGDPGGSVSAIGLFTDGPGLTIPTGTDLVQTSGHSVKGIGQALYAATTNTGTCAYRFQSANGRWFELVGSPVASVVQFGAIADGTNHQLSERFGNLAAAQAIYPAATALTQSIDWAAAQAAHDRIEGLAGSVLFDVGSYWLSDSISVGNYVALLGTSRRGCKMSCPGKPVFANKYGSISTDVTIRDFLVLTCSHVVNFNAGSVRYHQFSGLDVDPSSTIGVSEFQFNRLECTIIRECMSIPDNRGGYFIDVQNYPFNSVEIFHVRTTCSGLGVGNSVALESVTWFGGSWEAGGQPGKAAWTISGSLPNNGGDIASKGLSFIHVYMENIDQYLLKARFATATKFQNCKVTGSASSSGIVPSMWQVDNSIITFDTNYFDGATQAPPYAVLIGANTNLIAGTSNVYSYINNRAVHVTAAPRMIVPGSGNDPNAPMSVLTFVRASAGTVGGQDQQVLLDGVLKERVSAYTSDTGAPAYIISRYRVTVWGAAGSTMTCSVTPIDNVGNGSVFTTGVNVGTTPTLANIVLSHTGINANGRGYKAYSFEADSDFTDGPLSVALA